MAILQEMPPGIVNALVGVGSAAITLLITLYVKDSARQVVAEAFVKAQGDLKKDISAALSVFKDDLLKSLDQTYRRSAECELMMEQSDDRKDLLEVRMNASEMSIRDLNNLMHKVHKTREA